MEFKQNHNMQDLLDKIASLEQTVTEQATEIQELKKSERTVKLTNEIKEQSKEICRLRKENISDILTVLFNRKGFEQSVRSLIAGKGRRDSDTPQEKPTAGAFLMFDLDKFKPINDTHGHQAGDECLKIVGETINNMIRDTDYAARLGGDEFVVFLPGNDIDGVTNRGKEIQETINNLTVEWNHKTIDIGASMGIATYSGSESYTELYEKADTNLYKDKLKRADPNSKPRKQTPQKHKT